MNIGMLWQLETSNKPLEQKVQSAMAYYWRKYGALANACYVNPAQLETDPLEVDGVPVKSNKGVPNGYAWIGVESE